MHLLALGHARSAHHVIVPQGALQVRGGCQQACAARPQPHQLQCAPCKTPSISGMPTNRLRRLRASSGFLETKALFQERICI